MALQRSSAVRTTKFSWRLMKSSHASVYSYLSLISLWYFVCPPTHQHLPVLPVGLCWVTVQPAQIISHSSEIPQSSNTLSWPPRNPPTFHTWDWTSALRCTCLLFPDVSWLSTSVFGCRASSITAAPVNMQREDTLDSPHALYSRPSRFWTAATC